MRSSRARQKTHEGVIDRAAAVGSPVRRAAQAGGGPSELPAPATTESRQSGDSAPSAAADHSGHTHTAAIVRRLARATGHLEAVRRMVEQGRDCPDVLIQLAAVRAALDATAKLVLADHVESCLKQASRDGDPDRVWRDLDRALQSFIR